MNHKMGYETKYAQETVQIRAALTCLPSSFRSQIRDCVQNLENSVVKITYDILVMPVR